MEISTRQHSEGKSTRMLEKLYWNTATSFSLHCHGHVGKNVYEVVKAIEVAVLTVALHPRDTVVQDLAFRQRGGFAKVYHPHFRPFVLVMDKKQRAANHLNMSGAGKG